MQEIQMGKSGNVYLHKYQHYCFECECHPNDSQEDIEEEFRNLHLS